MMGGEQGSLNDLYHNFYRFNESHKPSNPPSARSLVRPGESSGRGALLQRGRLRQSKNIAKNGTGLQLCSESSDSAAEPLSPPEKGLLKRTVRGL